MKILKNLARSMICVAAGLLLYCGSFYIKSYEQNKAAREKNQYVEQLAYAGSYAENDKAVKNPDTENNTGQSRKKSDAEKAKNNIKAEIRESFGISWEKLRKLNPQTVGWIRISGADISYPVVQGEDDEFYLKHDFERKEDLFGSIFLGHHNDAAFTDSHSFIYGHNMEGHMMFANLNQYEQPEFLEKCPQFEIVTPEKKLVYDIFSVEQAGEGGAAFEYGYDLDSPSYQRQLAALKRNSMYETGIWPDAHKPMVTLITCNSRLDEKVRMAVHGICSQEIK